MSSNILELLSLPLSPSSKRELQNAINSVPVNDLANEMLYLGQRLDANILGFALCPLLKDRLVRQPAAFKEVLASISEVRSSKDYQLVMLDLLDNVARRQRRTPLWERYVASLPGIADQPLISEEARVKAIRSLTRADPANAIDALKNAISSKNAKFVNAAAHTIGTWIRKGKEVDRQLLSELITYSNDNHESVFKSPSVMRALALSNDEETRRVLHDIGNSITENEQRDAMLAAIGTLVEPSLLTHLLQHFNHNPTDEGMLALKGIMIEKPQTLRILAEADKPLEFMTCLLLSPYVASGKDFMYVRNLIHDYPDFEASNQIARLVYEAAYTTPQLPPQLAEALEEELALREPMCSATSRGYATGLQVGDAIYRWTSSFGMLLGNHWHAGLFVGFRESFYPTVFSFHGVQVNANSYAVQNFSSVAVINSADADLEVAIRNMKQDFLIAFKEDEDVVFEGARAAPDVSYYKRKKVVDTALAMVGKDIGWTWTDQLDYCRWDWDGTIDDIDEIRCDGVVEYAYEWNGIRVCGGTDPEKWNIAHPGTDWPENHNDFHGYGCNLDDYERGQLCPRIQAGNIGDDSSFYMPSNRKPEISDFAVVTSNTCSVWISFSVSAKFSRDIYVRLLVRNEGHNHFFFLQSADPLELGFQSGGFIEGIWSLKKISLSALSSSSGLFWMGKTAVTSVPKVYGPNYYGQSGTYEFKLQCIDEGGNVSKEWTCSKEINWSS